METSQVQSKSRPRSVWAGLILIVLLLAGAAVWKSARSAASMSAGAGSDEVQFTQAAAGTKAKVVLEIAEVASDGTLRGKLLQKKTEEIYARTPTKLVAHMNEHTAFVMGKREDARATAVVHVTGTVREDRSIDADQVVILTGYVHVE
jgi:hypothetical protein